MAKLELFATQNCWECSSCHQKYNALWRPVDHPIAVTKFYNWVLDKPSFRYCPMCGEEFEQKESEVKEMENRK